MHILVAEDERNIAAFIKRGLEEEGYAVETVGDGADALEHASSDAYDAIVLDLMLPTRDGLSVCRGLRERGSEAPVLMLTARDALDDKIAGFNCGADDYLTKPFAFEELVARLSALLRRPKKLAAAVLRVADLTLDASSRSVTRAGRNIELTNREFQLLHFLMQRAGTVQARATILQRVWGYRFEGTTNVLEVFIRLLRQKIDQGHSRPLVRTVRGVGYVIAE